MLCLRLANQIDPIKPYQSNETGDNALLQSLQPPLFCGVFVCTFVSGLGMSMIMKRPMLMVGAVIPGSDFLRISLFIANFSFVLFLCGTLFLIPGSYYNKVLCLFHLSSHPGIIPRCHLAKWRDSFQWGLW